MDNFYSKTKEEVLNFYNSNFDKGISDNEIQERKIKYGENKLQVEKDLTFFQLYLVQVKSFLNLLLLFLIIFALGVWYITNNEEYLVDSIIITVIFLINTLIGAYQNYNSRKIAKTLSSLLIAKVIVLRDGVEKEISSQELVCGDIIILKGGNKIPADCYLLESSNLKVDESILTGESLAVEKKLEFYLSKMK